MPQQRGSDILREINSPEFKSLSPATKQLRLQEIDPDFRVMSDSGQKLYIQELSQQQAAPAQPLQPTFAQPTADQRLSEILQGKVGSPNVRAAIQRSGIPALSEIATGGAKEIGEQARRVLSFLPFMPKEQPEFLQPQTGLEKLGGIGAQMAEFGVGGNVASAATRAATRAMPTVARILGPTFTEALTQGTAAAGVGRLQGQTPEQALTTGVLTGGATAAVPAIANQMKESAKTIINRVLKPTKTSLNEGFKAENVFRYNLGGTAKDTITKSQERLNQLTGQLRGALQKPGEVDVLEVIGEAEKAVMKPENAPFAKRLARQIDDWIEGLQLTGAGSGKVDLVTANKIKQTLGDMGSWVDGMRDAESTAVQKFAEQAYTGIRKRIESEAAKHGADIAAINRQIGDIIPIRNVAMSALPSELRAGTLKGIDVITGIATAAGHPAALSISALSHAQRSPAVANLLNMLSQKAGPLTQGTRVALGTGMSQIGGPQK